MMIIDGFLPTHFAITTFCWLPPDRDDAGSKRDIYDLMNELTNDGVSIIMVSSELPEVLGMSDRVMVIHEGRVAGILDRSDATPESIMTLATGGQ